MDNNTVYSDSFQKNIRKYREIKGLSQIQLGEISGLDRSTIAEIERKRDHNIKVETLKKLMEVIEDEKLLDDYCRFILNQKEEIKRLIDKFGKEYLCNTLGVHRSTLERWGSGKYQVKREIFEKIKSII
ncbi:helix-turn-helix domain-containing protein [Clostridium celatum]|uniref:helix-turn-helix domain-containing protein n=1 Tax=Clostridium celatum TaxID=36834 RepID=UPI001A9ACDD7|nr:helix-turn-helix transcriptional regulator [Clostridium celatum]